METDFERLTAEVLSLSTDERAAFAQMLIASLDADPAIDHAWAEEVDLRIAEVEDGTVDVIPMPEALANVRALLK